jgi:hypothetical protein
VPVKGRRLVLDTNCLRGLSEGVLRALVGRGFRLSVSMIALEESLARSHRENSIARLRTRLQKLSEFVDPAEPITPVGTPLYYSLGATFGPARDAVYAKHNRVLPTRWKVLSQASNDEVWRREAASLNDSIDRNATDVRGAAEAVRGLPKPSEPVSKLRGWTISDLSRTVSLRYGAQERLHAFGACLAQMIYGAAGATPATNDSEDIQLLQHLAGDVIVLTSDYRFIERVDRTGSFQAPYVRTPWEVLLRDIPPGPPWGRCARRAKQNHTPRDRPTLVAMEKDALASRS